LWFYSNIVIVQDRVIVKNNLKQPEIFCAVTLLDEDVFEIEESVEMSSVRSASVVVFVFEGIDRIGSETRSDNASVVTKPISSEPVLLGMELSSSMGTKLCRIELDTSLGSILSMSVALLDDISVGNGDMVGEGAGLLVGVLFRFSLLPGALLPIRSLTSDSVGLAVGADELRIEGRNVGTRDDGCLVGGFSTKLGIELGTSLGCIEGSFVGRLVGPSVGLCVGLVVGPSVGLCVGLVVGPSVGLCVGIVVGPSVGLCVGLVVGPREGRFVGINVGNLVGPLVGLIVSLTVGN